MHDWGKRQPVSRTESMDRALCDDLHAGSASMAADPAELLERDEVVDD